MNRNASGTPPKFAVTAAAAMTIWRSAPLLLFTTAYASSTPMIAPTTATIAESLTLLTSDVR